MDLEKLNPGIRATVAWLRENGFQTCDSGDGATHEFECDLPHPYVHMVVTPETAWTECQRLKALLAARGVQVQPMNAEMSGPSLTAHICGSSGFASLSLYNVKL